MADADVNSGRAGDGTIRLKFGRLRSFLFWLRRDPYIRKLPDRYLKPIDYILHLTAVYNMHKREVLRFRLDRDVSGERRKWSVPQKEHVSVPSLFVVELYLPSQVERLERAVNRHDWASRRQRWSAVSMPTLRDARSSEQWQWWTLGSIVGHHSRRFLPDAYRAKLPPEFESVELRALQVGQGITAVVVEFAVTKHAASSLDHCWHNTYKPQIDWGRWRGRWPRSEISRWVAFRTVQERRGRIHLRARRWLAETAAGAFASNGYPQPLVDVLIFEQISGRLDCELSTEAIDQIRALGLPNPIITELSEQFPSMVFAPADSRSDSDMDDRATWSLWGQRSEIFEDLRQHFKDLSLDERDASVSFYVAENMVNYLLRRSISELLNVMRIRYATIRDNASRRHGTFRRRYLEQLRSDLITLSLDLNSVARDVTSYNTANSWRNDEAVFMLGHAPYSVAWVNDRGVDLEDQPVNMNAYFQAEQTRVLAELATADRDYREILTAAASLSSSLQSSRAGAIAMIIAFASLIVAAMTMLLAEAAQDSVLDHLWSLLGI